MSSAVSLKDKHDVSQIFLTYLAFGGDADKASMALDLDVAIVRDLARAENWDKKVAQNAQIREGEANDVQIQINRAINYVQSHRLRSVIDATLLHLTKDGVESMVDKLTVVGREGQRELKIKAITDLVKAAESVQLMTQRALGDTAGEREPSKGKDGSQTALRVMEAMNAADESGLNSTDVVRKELALSKKQLAERI